MKLAAIGAGTVIAAVALFTYCSPYQTCVRAKSAQMLAADEAYQDSAAKAALDAANDLYVSPTISDAAPGPQPMTEDEAKQAAQISCANA